MSIEPGQESLRRPTIEVRQIFGHSPAECLSVFISNRHGGGNRHFQRVDVFAILPDAVIEVRTGAFPRVPHIRDNLPLHHMSSLRYPLAKLMEVAVTGYESMRVFNFEVISEPCLLTPEYDVAVAGSYHWGSNRRGVVYTEVRAINLANRMKPSVRKLR